MSLSVIALCQNATKVTEGKIEDVSIIYFNQSNLKLVAGGEAEPLHHVTDAERAVGGAEHVLDAVEPGLAGSGAGRPGR